MVHVIRLASFLLLWFQYVCPLMPSRNIYRLFGFLLPWSWGISSQLLQQSAALLLTLDEGYLLRATPPDLERGVALLGPPAPVQLPLLGHGVAPLIYCYSIPNLPPRKSFQGKILLSKPSTHSRLPHSRPSKTSTHSSMYPCILWATYWVLEGSNKVTSFPLLPQAKNRDHALLFREILQRPKRTVFSEVWVPHRNVVWLV